MLEEFASHKSKPNEHVPYEARIKISVGEQQELNELEELAQKLSAIRVYYSTSDAKALSSIGESPISISPVDSRNKYSEGYGPCTGLVVMGTEANGKTISLLTHQMTTTAAEPEFQRRLATALQELRQRSVPGSLDAVIFGGNVFKTQRFLGGANIHDDKYKETLQALVHTVIENVEVEPRVFGPNESGTTSIVVDTAHRRVHMRRSEGQAFGENFDKPAGSVINMKKNT